MIDDGNMNSNDCTFSPGIGATSEGNVNHINSTFCTSQSTAGFDALQQMDVIPAPTSGNINEINDNDHISQSIASICATSSSIVNDITNTSDNTTATLGICSSSKG